VACRDLGAPVILIWDNLNTHISKVMRTFTGGHPDWLTVIQLPGEDGWGRQPDLDGGFFKYPPDAFGRGLIAGRAVGCLSARQQRRFHDLGYEHRPQDVHDLAQLDAIPASKGQRDARPPARIDDDRTAAWPVRTELDPRGPGGDESGSWRVFLA